MNFRYAFEVRHESFFVDEFFDMLQRFNFSLVVADSKGLWPYADRVTSDFIYVRFHGSTGKYAGQYGKQALQEWAQRLRQLQRCTVSAAASEPSLSANDDDIGSRHAEIGGAASKTDAQGKPEAAATRASTKSGAKGSSSAKQQQPSRRSSRRHENAMSGEQSMDQIVHPNDHSGGRAQSGNDSAAATAAKGAAGVSESKDEEPDAKAISRNLLPEFNEAASTVSRDLYAYFNNDEQASAAFDATDLLQELDPGFKLGDVNDLVSNREERASRKRKKADD